VNPRIQDVAILFVDDESVIRKLVGDYLRHEGFDVTTAEGVQAAVALLRRKVFDLVFTDLKMPAGGGMALLKEIKHSYPETEVVFVTGHGSITTAVEALKLGAYDYLEKPVEMEKLKLLGLRVAEKRRLERENRRLKDRLAQRLQTQQCGLLVGISEPMQAIYDLIERIRDELPTVLIQGDSGTGKVVVARTIHQSSRRNQRPFVAVNCGAIAEGQMESELFGHRRSTFSGGRRNKTGLFQAADGGTLFLDEVTELDPTLQIKLLQVLQEKRIRPVGADSDIPVDVRVVAATHRDIKRAVAERKLRHDLFYRLNVVSIHIPPLSARREDIPLLANHFKDQVNQRNHRQKSGIDRTAMDAMVRYDWPGNVRELENVIERACVLGRGDVITLDDLPRSVRRTTPEAQGDAPLISLKENEIRLIRKALEMAQGHKTSAARLLGIDPSTLYRKIRRHGLSLASYTEKE
jgi:DNA-binding NtrC family response regulator